MGRKLAVFSLCALVASIMVTPIVEARDPTLVGWWKCDEGEGTTARDSSGYGNDGVFTGAPQWVTGHFRGGLAFNGSSDCLVCGNDPSLDLTTWTISFWLNAAENKNYNGFVIKGLDAAENYEVLGFADGSFHFPIMFAGGARTYVNTATGLIVVGEWAHFAYLYDPSIGRQFYKDGSLVFDDAQTGTPQASTDPLVIANERPLARYTHGTMDDVRIYSRALTAEELADVMSGKGPNTELADKPSPENEATDVPRDAVLAWEAGEFAATHDVYFGTSFDDVNNAGRDNPRGVLAGQGQADAAFDPEGLLEYGQVYYWRVDEVNGTADGTIFKGETWSFTAEPLSYPVKPIAATASSAQAGMSPENTINGSGLNANDEHSNVLTQMWMSAGVPQPNWIQYEFDKVYQLDQLWVWNSNQLIETFLGFGARNVTVECSVDGQSWTALEGVPEFAKATATPTYKANTIVDFGGTAAKFVKLTINQNWGGVAPQSGLSEVRFFYIPVQAFAPKPEVDATEVGIDTELSWRPGREAESHEVYLGTDENALALAKAVPEHSYTPASLDFGTTYFWKVNEIGGGGPYEGEVWTFTTQEYAPIDNFESYNDDDNRIYDSWIDGLTTGNSGSQVGYDVSPFAEKKTVHGGTQAMPLMYDNSAAPFISEAERTFASPQNWTSNGADSLSLYISGNMPAFAETASGSVLMNAIGTDIWDSADQFRYAFKTLNGNGTMVARVDSLFNSNAWAKGGVMIRQSIEPGSTHAFMAITPGGSGGGNGASFQRRLLANQASTNNDSTTVVAAPYWVKIERSGNNFSGSMSADGVTWTQLGTAQTIPMTGPVLIGLALCSHDAAVATGAEFSNIALTGNVTGAWQVAEIGAAQPAGNSVEGLYLTIKDSSGKSATVVNPDTAATVRSGWQQWRIPLSDFTSAGVKMTAVKSIVIGVGNKAAPAKGGSGKLFLDDLGYGRPRP